MPQPYQNELQFIQTYLAGDRRAELSLFKQLNRIIHKLLNLMEKKGSAFQDKQNIVSEIISQLMVMNDYKILRSYRGQCKLSTYLWPIVRNKIVDAIRKEVRDHSKIVYQEIDEQMSIDGKSSSETMATIIEEHIENAPSLERLIKTLKWIQGFDYQQIIAMVQQEFPTEKSINSNRIAYILHTNRKYFQKKFKMNHG